jgi:hypothetical protein
LVLGRKAHTSGKQFWRVRWNIGLQVIPQTALQELILLKRLITRAAELGC